MPKYELVKRVPRSSFTNKSVPVQGTVTRKIHDTYLGGGTGFCEGKPTFRRPIAIFFTRSNTSYAKQADDQKNISDWLLEVGPDENPNPRGLTLESAYFTPCRNRI